MESNICRNHSFHIADKKIEVYSSSEYDSFVIYLNTFGEEGKQVYQTLCNAGCQAFSLVVISNLAWNHDMAPWNTPPISKNAAPCTGGADNYLHLLTDEIIPKAESYVPGRVLGRGLAGYSLAGLFALYSLYRTDVFSRIASISGSLWFPDFKEYIFSHEMKIRPKRLYLSLGDREHNTGNPYLKAVQTNTEEINAFYSSKGIDIKYQLNPGGHHKNVISRTASGLEWLLRE